jgi:hypothetical protein
MRTALGARAGFVGADNGGHYVYGTGSLCADRATNEFLTQGTLPRRLVPPTVGAAPVPVCAMTTPWPTR